MAVGDVLGGLIIGSVLLMILLGILWFALLIWSLIDILKARNEPTWKILWIVVIALIPFIGVILYYFIGRGQKTRNRKK